MVLEEKLPKNRKIFHIYSESEEFKRCCTCKSWKLLNLFSNSKRNWDNLKKQCKDCEKDYYLANKEKKNKQRLQYQRKNKEVLNEKRRVFRKNNNQKVTEYYRNYHLNRCKKDPIYKLSKNIRRLIQLGFKNQNLIKDSKTKQILGVGSWNELYNHLTQTFYQNYKEEYVDGKYDIHIDHIVPVSLAKNKEDLIKLNHFSNLQFLKAKDNLSKSNKYEYNKNEVNNGC